MRILVVANYRHGYFAPFIVEQVDALRELGVEIDFFPVLAKGIKGYLSLRKPLIEKIKKFQPDIIHAHYGLSCLLANLQRRVPVVSTYHGSDINVSSVRVFSRIAIWLSAYNIFVSQKNIDIIKPKNKFALIPCGVDIEIFIPMQQKVAREMLGLNFDDKLVLFAGSFSNRVKNYSLAKSAIEKLEDVKLMELKGYSREEVAVLMNGVDACLMTSFTEGSPQFIKEAMSCGCPIVSVGVGDVVSVVGNTEGCYISSYDKNDCAEKIQRAIIFSKDIGMTSGRERVMKLELDGVSVVEKIVEVYNKILKNRK